MKIKSDIIAGISYDDCTNHLKWWKLQANLMRHFYENPGSQPPSALWFPGHVVPPVGGWVGDRFIPDQSSVCTAV